MYGAVGGSFLLTVVISLRYWLHRKQDMQRAQQIAWRTWTNFIYLCPAIHVSVNVLHPTEATAGDALRTLQSGSLLAPALLLTGIISGSFGISFKRKLRYLGAYLLELSCYFVQLGTYCDDKLAVFNAIISAVSCFAAGARAPAREGRSSVGHHGARTPARSLLAALL